MSQYKIQFLSDEDFDALPGDNMTEKVGVAYPASGVAYARRTGVNALDAFTALHELEHLKGNDLDEHFDAENGCYYKGFGDIVKTIIPFALSPVIGPVLGSVFKGIAGIGGNMGLGNIFGQFAGAGAKAAGGYAANAGNVAKGIGMAGIGSGTAAGSAAASTAAGIGVPSLMGMAKPEPRIGAGQMINGQAVHDATTNVMGPSMLPSASSAPRAGASIASPSVNQIGGAAKSLYDSQQSPLDQFGYDPGLGSPSSAISGGSNPNVIAGSSGAGSAGGPGGAPGAIGGTDTSKLRRYLDSRDNGGNGGYVS